MSPWPNVIAIAVIGTTGTLVATRGTRATMVGWTVIGWAIYFPLLVEATSVANCALAIVAGTGVDRPDGPWTRARPDPRR